MRGLGEHVFDITFILFIAVRGVEERRATSVAREAFYMKEAFANVAYLLVLGATVKLGITHCTYRINR